MLILIAEDDESLGRSLTRLFALEGHQTVLVINGLEALQELEENQFDMVILDWNMPEYSGFEVCTKLREQGDDTPILMLTARDGVDDRVDALDHGADDYLVKPFENKELVARVNALRRRSANSPDVLKYGDLQLDQLAHRATYGEHEIKLGRIEWRMLEAFIEKAEQVCSPAELYKKVWGYNFQGLSNTLEVHIGYLRKRLANAGAPHLIHTVRGYGYVLRYESEDKE